MKKITSTFFVIVIGLFAIACSKITFSALNFPTHFSDVESLTDIAYGKEKDQKLDLYFPPNFKENEGKAPLFVFIHGGRWSSGKKDYYAFLGHEMARQGYLTIIPDHRKYPEVKFPTFMEDAALMLKWVHQEIGQYGGDRDTLFLSGHSSGAHIAALLLADRSYLAEHKLSPAIVTGFIGLSGPYDFTPVARDLKDMFGPEENYPAMRVTTFIEGNEPPMLLIHGREDRLVELYNLERLETKIQEKGGWVRTMIIEDMRHIDPIREFTWVSSGTNPILQAINSFIDETVAQRSSVSQKHE